MPRMTKTADGRIVLPLHTDTIFDYDYLFTHAAAWARGGVWGRWPGEAYDYASWYARDVVENDHAQDHPAAYRRFLAWCERHNVTDRDAFDAAFDAE